MDDKQAKHTKLHLLMYVHYYYPDVASTGQIMKELAEGMLEEFRITVICVVPSYGGTVSSQYKSKKYFYEELNGVNIIRIHVPDFDKTKKISRIKNVAVYFGRALGIAFKVGAVDYVYSISQPPILGGLLGVWGKWVKHAKFIYNIQDFNPEQIAATGYSRNPMLLKMMMAIDKLNCRQSDKVIVVGRDMADTLRRRFKGGSLPIHTYINNWIDEKKIYPLPERDNMVQDFRRVHNLSDKFILMYSGNLGLYYDLEWILTLLEQFPKGTRTQKGREITFVFVGDGSIREQLVKYQEMHRMENVLFLPYQAKEALNYSLNAADVHWCISARGIKGVSVPSKLYGIMAAGKPVIGVMEKGAEARYLLEQTQCGLVCEPGDGEGIQEMIRWFIVHDSLPEMSDMGLRGREYLEEKLAKGKSIANYIKEIKSCK